MRDKKSICHRLPPDIRHLLPPDVHFKEVCVSLAFLCFVFLCLCFFVILLVFKRLLPVQKTSKKRVYAVKALYIMWRRAATWQRRKIYILFSAKTAMSGSSKSFTPPHPPSCWCWWWRWMSLTVMVILISTTIKVEVMSLQKQLFIWTLQHRKHVCSLGDVHIWFFFTCGCESACRRGGAGHE